MRGMTGPDQVLVVADHVHAVYLIGKLRAAERHYWSFAWRERRRVPLLASTCPTERTRTSRKATVRCRRIDRTGSKAN